MTTIIPRDERVSKEFKFLALGIAKALIKSYDIGSFRVDSQDFSYVSSNELYLFILECVETFFKDNYGVQDT